MFWPVIGHMVGKTLKIKSKCVTEDINKIKKLDLDILRIHMLYQNIYKKKDAQFCKCSKFEDLHGETRNPKEKKDEPHHWQHLHFLLGLFHHFLLDRNLYKKLARA
jgi:hypothetical protein